MVFTKRTLAGFGVHVYQQDRRHVYMSRGLHLLLSARPAQLRCRLDARSRDGQSGRNRRY
jgi:hypothetical protein